MGPATASPEKVAELVSSGMDVARLNFSHGSHADHQEVYDLVRTAAKESGRAVGVLGDLQGPKIRLGTFADGPVEWRTGAATASGVEGMFAPSQTHFTPPAMRFLASSSLISF